MPVHGSHRPVSTVRWLALVVALLLVAALPALPAAAGGHPDCPPPLPTAELAAGTTGTGYTVVRGSQPEPFDVEVLGVLPHALGPGRDLIVVDTSGPAIEAAGGVWAGMSGSPVYIGDRLVGAIAYGPAASATTIAGVTPAEDMHDLLAGQVEDAAADAVPRELTVRLPRADDGQRWASVAGIELRLLPLPLGISGLRSDRRAALGAAFTRAGAALQPFAAGAAGAPEGIDAQPRAGGNFASVLAYGDLTAAGIGTTTMVCGDEAIAFGHPMLWDGATVQGANDAVVLGVVPDLLGPMKIAHLAGTFGTVEEDRLAGVRAVLGRLPPLAPVTSVVTDEDRGRPREGRTDVVHQPTLPMLAAMHLLGNIDVVIDRVGEGTSTVAWSAAGTADGEAWTLERGNRFASEGDIAGESVFELEMFLTLLARTPLADVVVEDVAVEAAVEEAVRISRVEDVEVSVDGAPPAPPEALGPVPPGALLEVHVTLLSRDRRQEITVALELQVPQEAVGMAFVEVNPHLLGVVDDPFPVDPGVPGFPIGPVPPLPVPDADADTFEELLEELANAPRNDEVVARLVLDPEAIPPGGGEPPEGEQPPVIPPIGGDPTGAPGDEDVVDEDRERIEQVVEGSAAFPVPIDAGPGEEPPEPVARIAGAHRIATAVALSQESHPEPGTVDTVVLARADTYPDALAGGPLATALGGPLLLTGSQGVDTVVSDELERLGATAAVLLGGEAALSADVETDLADAGLDVTRHAGATRYDTARLIAEQLEPESAYLVRGQGARPDQGWADAVSVSSLAAAHGRAVLLTPGDGLPSATSEAIAALGDGSVTIVGGAAAVSQAVEDELAEAGVPVDRVAGANRYETSALVAERAVEEGAERGRLWLATGRLFPDALAAGPAVAADGGVLLLTDPEDLQHSPAVLAWLEGATEEGTLQRVRIVGGSAAIGTEVEEAVRGLVAGPEPGPDAGGWP